MHEFQGQKLLRDPIVDALIRMSLEEDFGNHGDVTGRITPETARAEGELLAKEAGVISGMQIAKEVFRRVDGSLRFSPNVDDGDSVEAGTRIATVSGWARSILAGERTVLNFLQQLSGVATLTRAYVRAVEGTAAKVLDTRKTPPGWRALMKYAVSCGGGTNHRVGLYDMVLIKDNHLALLGGEQKVPEAIAKAMEVKPNGALVEVEVTSVASALLALDPRADIILLDNMPPKELAEAVKAIRYAAHERGIEPPLVEASGGITLETIAEVAKTGVDRISVGALTHSAKALDISLDMTITQLEPE